MTETKTKSPRGRLTGGTPNPVDIHVGNRIKLRRKVLHLSQQQMAEKMGLTFRGLHDIIMIESKENKPGGAANLRRK